MKNRKRIVAPSLLSSNFLSLGKEIEMLNRSVAEWLHLDIMDGSFVPNISFGLPVVQAIASATEKVVDTHLMIVHPEKYIEAFAKAGSDIISVHYETCPHLHRVVMQIKDAGAKAGVVLNPHTSLDLLVDILPFVDQVLLMSVNPGFGGQKFIHTAVERVKRLRKMIDEQGLDVLIEVDGGINIETGRLLYDAGADALVAGNFVFGAPDPEQAIRDLLHC